MLEEEEEGLRVGKPVALETKQTPGSVIITSAGIKAPVKKRYEAKKLLSDQLQFPPALN